MAAMAVLSTRSGQRARSFRFGLRMVDFILSRIRSLSAARPSHFYQGLAKRIAVLSRPASRSGRFIKADGSFIKAGQPMAVLSTMAALSRLRTRPQWPLYQSEAAKSPDLLDLGCGWPISYGRFIKVEDQASGRSGRFINQKRPNGQIC